MKNKTESVAQYLVDSYIELQGRSETLILTAEEEWYLDAYFFYWCEVLGRDL
jgi:hypothetical protein